MSEGKPEERPSDSVLSGEQSFKMLADTLPELVFIVDKEFEGTFLNRRYAEFSALTTESGLGRGWQGILHPEDLEEALKKWRVSLETRSAYQCEQRLKNFDGEYIWHLVKALLSMMSKTKSCRFLEPAQTSTTKSNLEKSWNDWYHFVQESYMIPRN